MDTRRPSADHDHRSDADGVDLVRRARRGPRRRLWLVLAGLALLVVAAFAVEVLLGDYTYTIPDFFRILFGEQMPVATYILMESKLPRALLAVLVGVALGAGGACFQVVLRNPLASPDIIGISQGASVAALFVILELGWRGSLVSVAAVVGGLAAAVAVGWVAGGLGGLRLVLVGVGLAAGSLAVIQYLLTRADIWDVQLALRWLAGSLNNTRWPTVQVVAVVMAVALPLLWAFARDLRITELGDDAAAGLGVPRRQGVAVLLVATLLVAVGVAATGPVAFVAFMAGPIARGLNGGRATVVGAALTGAVIMLGADFVGNYLLGPVSMPVGIVSGALGAPFLLWLLARGAVGRSGT
ncbi:FecCD family ABC transporter permease [Nocardioides sp. GXQ0305]|uniref:FecCD family ABC transporter permease n=1 Tax=Nocardioides sp. GXQ0305 TaxID=3423912 RepID=UPI003D7DCCA7